MKRNLIALAGAVLAILLMALPAVAQSGSEPPTVIYVDARDDLVDAAVLDVDYETTASDVKVEQRGEDISVASVSTATQANWPVEVVFVVDVDNRNAASGELNSIGRAVVEAAEALPDGSTVAMVTAGSSAQVRVPMTQSVDRLERAAQQLVAERGAAIVDGVDAAGQLFENGTNRTNVIRSVVVFSGGADTASTVNTATASASLIQRAAQLVTVDVGPRSAALTDISNRAGGISFSATEREQIVPSMLAASVAAGDRLVVSFRPLAAEPDAIDEDRANLKITIDDQTRSISFPRGMETGNILQLAPLPEVQTSRFDFLGQPVFLYLSIALAFIGISMAVWALASMFGGGETSLDRVLARYSEGKEVDDEEVREMLVQTELIQRAVDFTENFAQRRGFLTRVEELLERADLPIRPGEGMFFLAGIAVVVFGLLLTVTSSLLIGLVGGLASAFVGYFVVVLLAMRRLRTFEGQLPDTLQLLAGTLRAGYSLPQGIDAVSHEIADPMGEELRRAMTEAQLGREIEDALGSVAERLDSDDFGWAVMAIGIQREVGGNLNELLMTVAETMVQRERLKREVAALTAEGRVSALIISLLPPGLGFVLWVMNPDYVGVLFSRTIGLVMLGAAFVSGLVGLLWMKKVITIDA